jgi:hypothetical protein
MVCDHRNGNGLDNSSENIRVCSVAQNNTNRRRSKNHLGVIGVTSNRGSYIARCVLNGRQYNLGRFKSLHEAVSARDSFVRRANPDFGYLNCSQENQ